MRMSIKLQNHATPKGTMAVYKMKTNEFNTPADGLIRVTIGHSGAVVVISG
jgi:hypothetical protein